MFDAARWPEGLGIVRLYAVTETDDGTYLACQFVPGARTLAECKRVRAGRRRRWVDEAAAVLGDRVHGRLTEHAILIGGGGEVWLTGFGHPPQEADPSALARIRVTQRGRPPLRVAAAATVLAAAGAVAALTLTAGSVPTPVPVPPVARGAMALGSTLAPGASRTVDCENEPPSGSSITCTVMQHRLDGRPLVTPFEGVVKAWAVRGARGRIALQILVPREGGFSRYNGTRVVTVGELAGTRVFRADRLVPKGARFGLEIEPGGAVGIRTGVEGAATARFFGLLRRPPEPPDLRGGENEELLLRVDVVRRRG